MPSTWGRSPGSPHGDQFCPFGRVKEAGSEVVRTVRYPTLPRASGSSSASARSVAWRRLVTA